jgi:hypothetical protein
VRGKKAKVEAFRRWSDARFAVRASFSSAL